MNLVEGEELTAAGTKGRRGACRDRGLEGKWEKVGARGGAKRVTRGRSVRGDYLYIVIFDGSEALGS